MTLAEQLEASKQLADYWRALMPGFDVPGPEQFLLWVGYYQPDIISRGINRAAAKRLSRHDGGMTVDEVVRYASGVMRNIRTDLKAQGKLAA